MLNRVIFILFLILVPAVNQACQVPVFRYALERWTADLIKIQASGEDESFFKELEKANIKVEHSTDSKEIAAYLNKVPVPFFKGKLKDRSKLVSSPVRTQIFNKLTTGTSAVWILLKSGNAEADLKAEETLSKSLAEAAVIYSKKIEEKKDEDDLKKDLLTSIPLEVKFEYISLDRHSAEENIFINMLLTLEPDLKEIKQPMAFAVYGRGRCLPPLIGKGISRNNLVNEDCAYLCGDCTCEVKEQNPGTDLLIAHDWEKALEGKRLVNDKKLPALTGINLSPPQESPSEPEEKSFTEVTESASDKNHPYNFLYFLLILPLAGFVIWRLK